MAFGVLLVGDRGVEELCYQVMAAPVGSQEHDAVRLHQFGVGQRGGLARGLSDLRLLCLGLVAGHEGAASAPAGEHDRLIAQSLPGVAHTRAEVEQDVLHLERGVAV